MLFMGGVLEMYDKLIDRMLGQLPTPSPETTMTGGTKGANSDNAAPVRKQLSYLLKKVKELRRHHYQEQNQLLHDLHKLDKIQVPTTRPSMWSRPWVRPKVGFLKAESGLGRLYLRPTLASCRVYGKANGRAAQCSRFSRLGLEHGFILDLLM